MSQIRLFSGLLTVGAWTMLSRIFGFVRDIMLAAFLGAGPVAEAFLVAFSLPNLFRRFFAEGAFNMAFVPMFSKRVDDPEVARAFARDTFAALSFILVLFSAVGMIFMPALVYAMAAGFSGDARFDLAVEYGRVAFPYVLFISLAALLSGVLNAHGKFVAAAAAPVLLNISLITAMLTAWWLGWDAGYTLVWTVPIAGFLQLALVWIAADRLGFRLLPRLPKWTPEIRQLLIIAGPAALAGGVVQINLLVGRQVASTFDGAIAWLSYADRLYQLPLGVVGIALGVVLLPDLSKRLKANDTSGGQNAFNRATELSLALTLPAAAALVAIPLPLITVLFERGAFEAADSQATALAVAIYGLGLPAFILQKVLQPLYFAREDTKRPFYFALAALVINAVCAIGLRPYIGFTAAAWGTTIAAWGMAGLLWWYARDMGQAARFDKRLATRTPKILAASLLMGGAAYGMAAILDPVWSNDTWRIPGLIGVIAASMIIYAVLARALGAFRISELKAQLKRS
ncbi:MAG: murein biosynthesis integral membrane protein MurJ [Pseudomonadota bacterium]